MVDYGGASSFQSGLDHDEAGDRVPSRRGDLGHESGKRVTNWQDSLPGFAREIHNRSRAGEFSGTNRLIAGHPGGKVRSGIALLASSRTLDAHAGEVHAMALTDEKRLATAGKTRPSSLRSETEQAPVVVT